jgi:hypothetical protein
MDDLLSEDWQTASKPKPSNGSLGSPSYGLQYNNLRPSPALSTSGVSTPHSISRPSSTTQATRDAPSQDRFGSLLSLKSQKPTKTLTLLEQQQKALSEKQRQQEEQSRLWDTLGGVTSGNQSRSNTPGAVKAQQNVHDQEEDDLLAAFDKGAPVNNASHFPPPSAGILNIGNAVASAQFSAPNNATQNAFNDDDDDIFGLGALAKNDRRTKKGPVLTHHSNDDDDILGDLGRPVTELPQRKAATATTIRDHVAAPEAPQDGQVAELVDMGFPIDNAKLALAENGGDVQRAVGWLLQQAHEESRQKAKQNPPGRQQSPLTSEHIPPSRPRDNQNGARVQRPDTSSGNSRHDGVSPARGDKDAAQIASDFGNKLFKGANSLWKASQKQMTKTISEFQQERDTNSPKWMQEVAADSNRSSGTGRARQPVVARREADITDEAAMLDAPREQPVPKASRTATGSMTDDIPFRARSPMAPVVERPINSKPASAQQVPPADKRYTSKLSRQEVEQQSAQAYVSPARRKNATPKPEPQIEPEVDLFGPAPVKTSTTVSSSRPSQPDNSKLPTSSRVPAPVVRPAVPRRSIPSVSASALSASAAHRRVGGEAFKRGDFGTAHEAYTRALTPLPATHPVTVVVLVNRCLTALKTGDPKVAVSDADRALAIIGDGQGTGETIDLGAGEASKDMREFYGKALTRKAEALEHLEKWTEAGSVWRAAIAAGVGGATSIRGRDRCDKASAPQSAAPKPRPAPSTTKAKATSPVPHPAVQSATSAEAVKNLRAANAAAAKADDEKFALHDQVEARLTAWKGGKADNLRALLQSLDTVLWPEAGWKKVGMSDLVMPNKVKINYMKAIAKVHPDKVSLHTL